MDYNVKSSWTKIFTIYLEIMFHYVRSEDVSRESGPIRKYYRLFTPQRKVIDYFFLNQI